MLFQSPMLSYTKWCRGSIAAEPVWLKPHFHTLSSARPNSATRALFSVCRVAASFVRGCSLDRLQSILGNGRNRHPSGIIDDTPWLLSLHLLPFFRFFTSALWASCAGFLACSLILSVRHLWRGVSQARRSKGSTEQRSDWARTNDIETSTHLSCAQLLFSYLNAIT